jgi:hypothetical protein
LAIFEIAYHLKLPLYELYEKMTYEELLGWFNYFERRPVDWRDDDRTVKLLQVQGADGKPWQYFTSLDAIYNYKADKEATFNVNSFKRSGLFQKLASAGGGENIFGGSDGA